MLLINRINQFVLVLLWVMSWMIVFKPIIQYPSFCSAFFLFFHCCCDIKYWTESEIPLTHGCQLTLDFTSFIVPSIFMSFMKINCNNVWMILLLFSFVKLTVYIFKMTFSKTLFNIFCFTATTQVWITFLKLFLFCFKLCIRKLI